MDRLIYTCSSCGHEQQDLASAAKIQFCFKCGGSDFTSRLADAEMLALKCEALLLVVSNLANRFDVKPEELLELVTEAEAEVRARSEQPLAQTKQQGAPERSKQH